MSEDEDDYMSDKFLVECPSDNQGLPISHAQKRSIQTLKRKQENDRIQSMKHPKLSVLEATKRNEGLDTAIDERNKGFAMLQKMGYKPGVAIGKTIKGRTEPVPITLKVGREGLGRDEERKRKYENYKSNLASCKKEVCTDEYRSRLTEKITQKQLEKYLRQCQSICEQLDNVKEVLQPKEEWFWRIRTVEHDEDEEESSDEEHTEDLLTTEEKIQEITTYLRSEYFYCVWCGIKFEDLDDMEKSCPGNSLDDH